MVRKKTAIQKAAGKLISAIQKEWGEELGEPHAEFSEDVMDRAHDLLQAGAFEEIKSYLDQELLVSTLVKFGFRDIRV